MRLNPFIQNQYVFALMLLLLQLFCGIQQVLAKVDTNDPIQVKMTTVPAEMDTAPFNFAAEIIATKEAELAFQVPGYIQNFDVKMGEDVIEGQVLVSLDPSDYQLQVDARRAQLELAEVKFNQAEQLIKTKLISENAFDQAKTLLTAAQTQLDEALTDLRYTQIIAPFNGVVSLTYANPHQNVAPKQPVMRMISRDEKLNLTFNLPVHLAEIITVDTLKTSPIVVTSSRFKGIRLKATFKEISTQPDPDTNSYAVELSFERPKHINMLPGMTGMVSIQPNTTGMAKFTIPNGAIISASGETAEVWLVEPQTQRLQKTTIAIDANKQLISGLSSGDTIVSVGAKALKQDQLVKPWQRERGI